MSPAGKTSARFRRTVALVLGVGIVFGGAGIAALNEQYAEAAPSASVLSGFDPSNIIDDAVMFDGATMTAGQIQTFLNGKQPSCAPGATCLKSLVVDMPAMTANPMCHAMPAQSNASAAQVIAAVGEACDVSPQVILVMLQKEQTLVTGRTPYPGETVSLIYRKATGLGCPDTAACDPNKYGLFNQLYGVAYWLVRYTTPAGTTGPGWTAYNWFPVGQPSGVLYNPNAACGAQTITIQNKATAALYYYTPYLPNAAALSAGWGLGDSCSAYGNRNFYLYFTTWFGSTHYATGPSVPGAIGATWSQLGGAQGTLGNPTGTAVTVSGLGSTGLVQSFQNGAVYASSAGAWPVTGPVLTAYAHLGGQAGSLGWPTTSSYTDQNGSVQRFQQGAIYVDHSGSFTVSGALLTAYLNAGGPTGGLGWPTAAPTTWDGRIVQRFAHGTVTTVSVPGFGAWPVMGSLPSKLPQGQALSAGHGLLSPDGRFLLTQQPDGNLVLYDNTGRALWGNGRFGPSYRTVMQSDGNLVQYTPAHRPVWATGTNHTGATYAAMQSDGNFVLYTRAGKPVWNTNTRGPATRFTRLSAAPGVSVPGFTTWPATGSRTGKLTEPTTLSPGQGLLSPDGRFLMTQQADGNLVLYDNTGKALWDSHRFGKNYRTVMQADGNLVQYTRAHKPVWATGTNHTGATYTAMQSDGNLVLYTRTGQAVWNTNTRG